MVALAKAGFRAIAPDFRGYGLSRNTDPSKNHWIDSVHDILGLLDALHLDKVYIVAKDWGAIIAYCLGYAHAERILGLAVLGIPFFSPNRYEDRIHHRIPSGHYIRRWAVPGIAEADFGRFDVATVIRRIYIMFCNSQMPIASETENTLDLVKASDPLPDWMTEEDLQVYAGLYEKSGFGYPMEVPYRCLERNPSEIADRTDFTIPAPLLLILGDRDYVVQMGMMAQTEGGFTPKLKLVYIEEGSHFVQEQFPEQINTLLIEFFTSQPSI